QVLEVTASTRDPQQDPATGSITFLLQDTLLLPNLAQVPDYCTAGVLGSNPGEGLVYAKSYDFAILADLDGATQCADGIRDFWFVAGTCTHPTSGFGANPGLFELTDITPPVSLCLMKFPSVDPYLDLT